MPSATPALIDMLLDALSHNTREYPLPDKDMFKDSHGLFTFAEKMRTYLSRVTSRACANLGSALGGGPGTNNAVENANKQIHHEFPSRRGAHGHMHDLLAGTHSTSLKDDAFNNIPRRDMFHQDLFHAVLEAQHLKPYVHFPDVSINLMDCAISTRMDIEELDTSKAQTLPGEGSRSWDLQKDLKKRNTHVVLLPTMQTMADVVQSYDTTVHGGVIVNGVTSAGIWSAA